METYSTENSEEPCRFLAVFSGMAALDVHVRLALVAHLDSGLKAREVKAWAGVAPSDGGPGCRFGKLSSPERAKPCYALSGLTHSRADLPGASLADSLHPRLSQPGLSALSAVGPAPVSPGPDSIPPKTAKNPIAYVNAHIDNIKPTAGRTVKPMDKRGLSTCKSNLRDALESKKEAGIEIAKRECKALIRS